MFPQAGVSLNAAALVWSKAPVIIGAHRPRAADPLEEQASGWHPDARGGQGARRPADHPGALGAEDGLRLRFVTGAAAPSLLVADVRGQRRGLAAVRGRRPDGCRVTVPIFLLVPQVQLPKRLDLARDAGGRTTRCRG